MDNWLGEWLDGLMAGYKTGGIATWMTGCMVDSGMAEWTGRRIDG